MDNNLVSYCHAQAEQTAQNVSDEDGYEDIVEQYYEECLDATPIPLYSDDQKYKFDQRKGNAGAIDNSLLNNYQ